MILQGEEAYSLSQRGYSSRSGFAVTIRVDGGVLIQFLLFSRLLKTLEVVKLLVHCIGVTDYVIFDSFSSSLFISNFIRT